MKTSRNSLNNKWDVKYMSVNGKVTDLTLDANKKQKLWRLSKIRIQQMSTC